jgi:DNA polymerase V
MTATYLAPLCDSAIKIPFGGQASCGFPSPAADYEQPDLSIDDLVGIRQTSSIFLFRAWGDSMVKAGIHDGDILVVDKAREAKPGHVVVAVIGAEFLVKRLEVAQDGKPILKAESDSYAAITLNEDDLLEIWGVCVWVLHALA